MQDLNAFFNSDSPLVCGLVGNGINTDESDWTVNDIRSGGPADTMGIEAGDRIIALNGVPITDWWDLLQYCRPTQ